jgi:two-component system, OmpR family, sensor histidine kinase VicK
MRWWLAAAFAGVAALTAVAVVSVLSSRSEQAFRKYAQNFAVGDSVTAAERLKRDTSAQMLRSDVARLATQRKLALFVFDSAGRRITPEVSNGLRWRDIPHRDAALRAALARNRFIGGARDGSSSVVGVLIHGGVGAALVAYSSRPELGTQLGIVRNEFLLSALIAIVIGAAAGFMLATLTGRRLTRIANTARALGAGDFTATVADRFPDEVGSLAESIEQMRGQLSGLFDTLSEDRARLERLLDRLEEAVIVVDPSLRIEFANGSARNILGSETLHDTGRSPFGANGEQALREFALRLFREADSGHLRLTTDDDRTFIVSGISPSHGSESAIVVLLDESQRERTERAQRNFATNAAHELRTPLASIVTATEMLQTGAKDDPAVRDEFLELIDRESNRLTRLTRALLVLARAEAHEEAPQSARIELRGLLDEVASGLSPSSGVEIRVECDSGVAAAGDRDLLEQALTNLATNALRSTTSGEVVLAARAVADGRVAIEVVDTGTGMSVGTQARAFDRFYRSDRADGGFGLGLSIARESVRALGGEIEIESTPEVGTTVRITLLAPSTAEAA